ncbi:helix-turn-helix domain-containing protein [Chryseobacterium sp. C-71]|uniref:helix-turn-helix domain-containing protein n=1 Tax=Chryseobacterium sp. C-71 TaxID=2893882 RepID=UPI001E3ED548|nr:helix-turn-helix transcriptional regulator [Chryseobacterium sp. C-71]UFH31674.1 helix-turn-helix domain-containing protein [Chryseobacterium sp. C-71]
MSKKIGLKVKKLREENGISQEDLAYNLEVSQSYLSKIENGLIKRIDFYFIQNISKYFKIDLQYFSNEEPVDQIGI